jgi:hypothetical protein
MSKINANAPMSTSMLGIGLGRLTSASMLKFGVDNLTLALMSRVSIDKATLIVGVETAAVLIWSRKERFQLLQMVRLHSPKVAQSYLVSLGCGCGQGFGQRKGAYPMASSYKPLHSSTGEPQHAAAPGQYN